MEGAGLDETAIDRWHRTMETDTEARAGLTSKCGIPNLRCTRTSERTETQEAEADEEEEEMATKRLKKKRVRIPFTNNYVKLEGGESAASAIERYTTKQSEIQAKQVEALRVAVQEAGAMILALCDRIEKLERVAERVTPRYTRQDGEVILIRDMNTAHLKNAILKIMRGEREIGFGKDIEPTTYRDLCAEAEKRGLDWKSWGPSTEPVTKFATRD